MSTLYFKDKKISCDDIHDDFFIAKGATREIQDLPNFVQAKNLIGFYFKRDDTVIRVLGDIAGATEFYEVGASRNFDAPKFNEPSPEKVKRWQKQREK
jgi:hypothetical protein